MAIEKIIGLIFFTLMLIISAIISTNINKKSKEKGDKFSEEKMNKKTILKQAKANIDHFSQDPDAFDEGLAKYKSVPLKTRRKLINKMPKAIRKQALALLDEEEHAKNREKEQES